MKENSFVVEAMHHVLYFQFQGSLYAMFQTFPQMEGISQCFTFDVIFNRYPIFYVHNIWRLNMGIYICGIILLLRIFFSSRVQSLIFVMMINLARGSKH